MNSKYAPSCPHTNQQSKWLYIVSLLLMWFRINETTEPRNPKIKSKIFKTLETYLISYGGGIFYCLLACYDAVQSIANLFFTGDYSKNKTGSQTSRAWDLHEAASHLRDQCCHFVDQATQIHHARCISCAKELCEVPIHWAILHKSKSGYRDDNDAEWLKNISSLHEIHLVHVIQCLYYVSKCWNYCDAKYKIGQHHLES